MRKTLSQLELAINRELEPDRNLSKGGRSFYFFDFDDNVAFLTTSIFLFEKNTGREISIPTGEFAQWGRHIGKTGPFADYEIRYEDTGSFRRFRDFAPGQLENFLKKSQPFIEDLGHALGHPDFQWKGPSWKPFYHASFNQRPVSVITARGHSPATIQAGINLLVEQGHLPQSPNYLGIYPVSNRETRAKLGDESQTWTIAALKQAAIRASVERAFEIYGYNAHHRFGMSDDDPHNLELIAEEMVRLKKDFPENSFFIIETSGRGYLKREIFADGMRTQSLGKEDQLALF